MNIIDQIKSQKNKSWIFQKKDTNLFLKQKKIVNTKTWRTEVVFEFSEGKKGSAIFNGEQAAQMAMDFIKNGITDIKAIDPYI